MKIEFRVSKNTVLQGTMDDVSESVEVHSLIWEYREGEGYFCKIEPKGTFTVYKIHIEDIPEGYVYIDHGSTGWKIYNALKTLGSQARIHFVDNDIWIINKTEDGRYLLSEKISMLR